MKKFLWAAMSVAACGVAVAKLPPLDDAAKAKAAEAAAKSAWQAKVDGYQLCKAQDKVAAAALTDNKGAPMKAGAATAAASAPVAAASARATAAAAPGAVAPAAAVVASAPAAAASGTPVATAAVIPPCLEPGPFAYNPPEQKPLETAGAHSPTGTAASPPSVKQDSAQMAPAKK